MIFGQLLAIHGSQLRCMRLLNSNLEFPIAGHLQVMHLIGDVKGKVAIMVDDMIDTAG
jgi:phosphoribosylpyrophosphate synthetase